jgi:MoaA/NifB/PqqE/SkfB family radical SAM enzyme
MYDNSNFVNKIKPLLSTYHNKQFFLRDDGENTGVNVDLSARCGLECSRCQRQTYFDDNKEIPGHDLTLEDFDKITDMFQTINFCGQLSDPVHNKNFIDILKLCRSKNVGGTIHNASSLKSKEWYIEAFKAHTDLKWVFGIDGLPKDSCKYRVNQDGEKLFDIMIESKKYLNITPVWQYIIFRYNENDIDEAKKLAQDNDINFNLNYSSKWFSEDDPLMPLNKNYRIWSDQYNGKKYE